MNAFKKFAVLIMALTAVVSSAQVHLTKEKITIDGRLDEKDWSAAPVQTDFSTKTGANLASLSAQTEFRVLKDSENIYIGVKCLEPMMDKLVFKEDVKVPWGSDLIEIFMAPTAIPDEYYQFVVSAGNIRWCMFYGEGGAIRPDPYFPLWETAVHKDKDFWSLEIRIPLSAFYMTRTPQWRSKWLFNIARQRPDKKQKRESSSWSKLRLANNEVRLFKTLGDFPIRPASQDVYLSSVLADIKGMRGSSFHGNLVCNFTVDPEASGSYLINVKIPGNTRNYEQKINLRSGSNRLILNDFEFPEKNKNQVRVELTKQPRGVLQGREYPVQVSYNPLTVKITSP